MTDLKGLTIARFFAAFGVVLFHLKVPGTHAAYTLVEFFFVLSGFILVYVSHNIRTKDERLAFYVRRFARIYPVYFLAWALYGLVAQPELVYGALSVVLLQSWIPTAAPAWNLPGWSLSAEAFFYAVFPFAIVYLRRLTTPHLIVLLATMLMLNGAFWMLVRATGDIPLEWVTVGGYLEYLPILLLPQFIAGAIMGLLFLRTKELKHAGTWSITITVAIIATMQLHSPYSPAFLAVLFCALVYVLGFVKIEGRVTEVFVLLGKASYAIYILQLPILMLLKPFGQSFYCVALVAISVAVYQYIERPAEKWIKSRPAGFGQTPLERNR